jgi:uncharacterized Zn finger protein
MFESEKNIHSQSESSSEPGQQPPAKPVNSEQNSAKAQAAGEGKAKQSGQRNQNRNPQNRQGRDGQKTYTKKRPGGQKNRFNRNSNRQNNENGQPNQAPNGPQNGAQNAERNGATNGARNGERFSAQNDARNNNRQDRYPRPNGERNGEERNGNGAEPWGMNPRRTITGIQTRSQRGEFAKNWWARRWLEALERLMLGVRLTRGQHYARIGQIVSMEEIKGGVAARVQGSRPKPYRVTIQLTPFNNKQWEKVFDILSDKAIYVAQLLAGDMPLDIEEVFNSAGVSLFPTRTIDLQTKCTCPDKITPCKHVAATHYILGDRFDEDPFLLFRMRGKTQEQILEALRQRRGADIDPDVSSLSASSWQSQPEPVRFPETLEHFWDAGHELKDVNVQVRLPNIPQPLLKRLGEPEVASQLTLQGQLEESYNSISQFAIMIAFADTSGGAANGSGEEEA